MMIMPIQLASDTNSLHKNQLNTSQYSNVLHLVICEVSPIRSTV